MYMLFFPSLEAMSVLYRNTGARHVTIKNVLKSISHKGCVSHIFYVADWNGLTFFLRN